MKKTLNIILILLFTALFSACSGNSDKKTADASSSKEAETISASVQSQEPVSAEDKKENPKETASSKNTETSQTENAPAAGIPEKLILGLDASFPPMGYTDENNNIVGVDIDLAKAVCEKLNIEFEAKPIDWASKEMELSTGKITVIWNGMTITEEREEAMEVSRPYIESQLVIAVKKGSDIKTKADLAGKVVAAQSDSSGLFAIQKDEIYPSIKDGTAKEYPDYLTALGDLDVGRCDALIIDSVLINFYMAQKDMNFDILEEKLNAESFGIAAIKGNKELINAIEGALSALAEEGKIAEISNRWFGKDDMIITY
ncbi:amino acid ABC transporter substrate-binding protein [Anaeropeptidivorans aminofermentans]|uniref:amino acid ABC transporter substrate-binding protein n=1 Tax=Anaeropeptidivorans aminofermentans TaxID=2934315 RepID=UPI002025B0EF|nr:amino acid ABC transporter substrate-binding protein [Anaeropeptidivorans aminofermentans]